MFRKRQTKILRVKDGEKRLVNSDIPWELTSTAEVVMFLNRYLGLESVRILGGKTIILLDDRYWNEFCDHFNHNEIVDFLIPNSVNLDGWILQRSRYV